MHRRHFLSLASVGSMSLPALVFARRLGGLKVGVTDWNLRQTAKLEAVGLAKRLGFEGVQVSLGRQVNDGKLPLDDADLLGRYLTAAKQEQIALDGTCLDVLHVNYLKNDKLGQKWVSDGIRLTKALQTKVMLLPFFGKGAIEQPSEQDAVAEALKDLAPEAERAGVILGLENTISAAENVRIMEKVGSPAVLVYYDIGNSTGKGFDVAREIRWLGRKRICQLHFKDNPYYLGEGSINMSQVMKAVADIDFRGFANLETDAPSKSVEGDMRKNLAFVRRIIVETQG